MPTEIATESGDRPRRLWSVPGARIRDVALGALERTHRTGPNALPLWLVSGTRRAADALLREAALERSWVGVHRASLLQWAAALADARPFLSELARLAGVRRALRETPLEVYGPFRDRPGFAPALAETFRELRAFGIEPEALSALAEGEPRVREMAQIYQRVLERQRDEDAVDPASVFASARFSGRFDAVLVDVPCDTPMEWSFVARACEAARSVQVVLRTGDPRLSRWEELLGVTAETVEPADDPKAGAVVDWFASASEFQEATEVARRIDRADTPFDRIAVVARNRSQQAALQAALTAAEIPAFWARGVRRPDPRGRAFLALLDCAEENLSAERFAEYMSFGQVPPSATDGTVAPVPTPWVPADDPFQLAFVSYDEEEERPASDGGFDVLDRWEHWLTEAAVVGSRQRWERRLKGVIREKEIQLQSPEADTERITEELRSLRRLSAFALPLVRQLDELAEPRTWGRWIEDLSALAGRALAEPESVLEVLAELRPMADMGPVDRAEVRDVLRPRLVELRQEPSSEPYGQVFVGTPEELRGRWFDRVFVMGLAEGQFPRPVPIDPLLPDTVRAALHPDLPLGPRHRRSERDRFAAVCSAGARITVSYSRQHPIREKAQIPSQFFLERLQEVLDRVPTWRDLRSADPEQGPFGPSWMVPLDPMHAVHPTEYDVAVARALADEPPEHRQGRLRYLFDEDATFAGRSLRARWARWSPRPSVYDGAVLSPGDERPELTDRPWSASTLQHFASCPYRFWLWGVMRFRPRPKVLAPDRLDPLTRGTIFHAMMDAIFRKNRDPIPSDEDVIEAWKQVADRFAEELAPAIPPVFEREMQALLADLLGWFRTRALVNDGHVPRHAELGFGVDPQGHDPASLASPVELWDGVRVVGAIDLVEEGPDGRLRVTDYKTSARPTRVGRVAGGQVLQPALYARVAEVLLGSAVDWGRLAYATVRAGFEVVDVPIDDRTRQALDQVIDAVRDHFEAGTMHAAPVAKACDHCDFRPHCGPFEFERVRRKHNLERSSLGELRRLE